MFLYPRSLKQGKEGGFLLLCIREDVLITHPGFVNVGKFGVLGNAGSDGKLIGGVVEKAVGRDGGGGEIDILHYGWRGSDVSLLFIFGEGFFGMC